MIPKSLSLLTDCYQLTMASGYYQKKIHEKEAVFHLFFRKKPFGGEYAIAAGLKNLCRFIEQFTFEPSDIKYLQKLVGFNGKKLFSEEFLAYLSSLRLTVDVDAIPEGTPIFSYEPFVRVKGPILQAQLLESILLNLINFETLIATKASRVCYAAEGDEVLEFGMRRAQSIAAALYGARATYIGGCTSTSTVLAGKEYGIPVKGTHAHSWVMAFPSEVDAFEAYAQVMPNNCIFLIDTYDSIEGVKHAIAVAKKYQEKGVSLLGVRLDSGDLAKLSIEARKLLDEAGFYETKIVASNELDEHLIRDLKKQGAKISVWGVGTKLITGDIQSALDGVYKLSAIRDENGKWIDKLKLSEQIVKVTDPGILQVKRFWDHNGNYIGDAIYDERTKIAKQFQVIHYSDSTQAKVWDLKHSEDLLIPVFRNGKKLYSPQKLEEIQALSMKKLNRFSKEMRRFLNPDPYFVGLEQSLYQYKLELIQKEREKFQ